ncbi:GntR family transcriptional regulator [Kordia sp. YSTF-M3]|uniref:GntR family transcriptional regulator n=1 Tax=Kordia aestuariivivens TaxID=2759037 RepID=A0ABR7Q903_9FLAO|nr:GntR family transcriptional regulator [Kordia aestuariivivens]MBC8755056.1 GntR family transcriptional regulator [Kordia aestuariivivens]
MIEKISYRDQVRNILLDRMKSGELKAGDKISLAQLSRELEVSVTPIREALTQLQQANIIVSIPNRGFVLPILKKSEVKNLYELVACLEGLAIENSVYTPEVIQKLKVQHAIFKQTTTAIERINADMLFHEVLVSAYENPISHGILNDLKIRIFFYEKGFMNMDDFHKDSEHHHEKIIKHLENNENKEVSTIIRDNWMQILNYTI